MKNRKNKFNIGYRRPLVENLLLAEGIGRAGKFLLANILAGIDGIEPVQYKPILEYIPLLEKFGFIENGAAKELLQAEIDMACYEVLIGRNLNSRRSDKSSIFNNPHWRQYIKRSFAPDGDPALAGFYKKQPYSLFILHDDNASPFSVLYFQLFPKLKIISIRRNPIDLVFSWHQRNLANRLGQDPKTGGIFLADKNNRAISWFMVGRNKDYYSLPLMDRTIVFICEMFKECDAAYKKISTSNKKKVCFVRYEDILTQPKAVTKKIAKFLNRKPLPVMRQILKNEHLPDKSYWSKHEEKIKKIEVIASSEYFKRLMVLEKKYFQNKNSRLL